MTREAALEGKGNATNSSEGLKKNLKMKNYRFYQLQHSE